MILLERFSLMKVTIILCALAQTVIAVNFTIINGQIFTPGLAIIDSPQPFTPEGGDFLQVAIDVSGDGKLGGPPYSPPGSGTPTGFYNITMFLYSYTTGLNMTISNGTLTANNGSLGDIMSQEPGSTVKHVNWNYPSCLVGDGSTGNSQRGTYNISIHQSFKLNNTNYYTIFDLPISITNKISAQPSTGDSAGSVRVPCDSINNNLVDWATMNSTTNYIPPNQYPFTSGNTPQVSINPTTTTTTPTPTPTTAPGSTSTGIGPEEPIASPGNGLGSGASSTAPAFGMLVSMSLLSLLIGL